uniref:Uncharacterized protein n=1 Tax=Helianthus annuus TaxID=4232 RepID=A0A251UUK3_HELAN
MLLLLLRCLMRWCVVPLMLVEQGHKAVRALVLWTMVGRSIGDFNRMRGRTTCGFSRIIVLIHGIFREVVLWTKRNESRSVVAGCRKVEGCSGRFLSLARTSVGRMVLNCARLSALLARTGLFFAEALRSSSLKEVLYLMVQLRDRYG